MNERLAALALDFFARVVKICPVTTPVDFIVVTHLLEDRPWFLDALAQLGRVVAVIPKRKSIVPRVRDILAHRYNLVEITRAQIDSGAGIAVHIKPLQGSNPLCLLDIGGYFAPLAAMETEEAGLNVAGVVEDTENGHMKYETILRTRSAAFPIYSVARSELKRPENYLVGQSLVYSVEAILRSRNELLHGRRTCVIGYGNIGRSVAQHLHARHASVTVYDIDPIKLIEAFTHGFRTPPSLTDAITDADILFCVTGNHSLGLTELNVIAEFTYIATVTSPDDELSLDDIDIEISHREGNITELRLQNGKVIYLMNRGQAVNFVHGSVVGPFIQLLQAEILATVGEMLAHPSPGTIGTISLPVKKQIAQHWMEVYRH